MGLYINPEDTSKEEWLETYGFRFATFTEAKEQLIPNHMIVCLVDNGAFTAAAILYNAGEGTEFSCPNDSRAKVFYIVGVQDLLSVEPKLSRYLTGGAQ